MSVITIEEDRQFLQLQRDGRIGYMAQEDTALSILEGRILERKAAAAKRKDKEDTRKEGQKTVAYTDLQSDSDINEPADSDNSPDYELSTPKIKKVSEEQAIAVLHPKSHILLQLFVVHLTDSKYQTELDQWYCQLLHTAYRCQYSALYQQNHYVEQELQTENKKHMI